MKKLAAILAAILLSGCISTVARVEGCWGEPYIGTEIAFCYAGMAPLIWADLPFDFALDTALLPVDLICMPFAKHGYNH